ncbi:hypothetical protein ABT010_24225 [Streptomyces sp. NPDC002668]|uniref:hypothetical protein n=1 Tax=Streptomyces sp. NPDC002668 TaxID=3154422 RepID=UPI00332D21E1
MSEERGPQTAQPTSRPIVGAATLAPTVRTEMETYVRAGDWRTVYWLWGSGVTTHGEFKRPEGAQIKVRYGLGWFGVDRQKQTLDGTTKVLTTQGSATYTRVRFQIKVKQDTRVRWVHIVEGPGSFQ